MYSTITMAESGSKIKHNFKSYLDSETENQNDLLQDKLQPKFLTGELEAQRAKNAVLYTTLTKTNKMNERDSGVIGLLVVTNFRLSFLTSNDDKDSMYQENLLLRSNDVTLSNIDCLYQIINGKIQAIGPQSKISSKLEGIQIVCKNFRVFKFGFKRCDIGKGKLIAEALAQIAFPKQHDLHFAYRYSEKYYNTLRNITMFNKKSDWSYELARCGAIGWRVLSLEREDSIPSGTLPMHFVIPRSISETDYLKLANYFRNGRTAIWVYSLENASLVRMAELIPTITDTRQENTILEIVRKCNPLMKQPFILELGKCLPNIQDVHISFTKLRDLCAPENSRQFMQQDNRFYSLLDKSCWLLYVSLCIKYSSEAALKMQEGQTVVLQEYDGRDMCCVISSLTQILLDPYFRTTVGFESLIQKEWVALGHPFSDRLGHVINSETSEQSPLLLLFLDCTWQLLQQFPEEFEFSETFLTTIWDSAFISTFDTFLFNSEHDRQVACKKGNLTLRPVWDWGEQFADKDLALFTNPLYKKTIEQQNFNARKSVAILPSSAIPLPGLHKPSRLSFSPSNQSQSSPAHHNQKSSQSRFLKPNYAIRDLEIWMQCYYRWLPVLEIKNGGNPQIDLYIRKILSNISKLQQDLNTRDFENLPSNLQTSATSTTQSEDGISQILPTIGSFFPFTRNTTNSNDLTDILTQSNDFLTEGSIFDGLSITQEQD